jgi:hypothetical protein
MFTKQVIRIFNPQGAKTVMRHVRRAEAEWKMHLVWISDGVIVPMPDGQYCVEFDIIWHKDRP